MKISFCLLLLVFFMNTSDASIEEQLEKLETAQKERIPCKTRLQILDYLEAEIIRSFHLENKKPKANLLVFLAKFRNKKSRDLSFLGPTLLEYESYNCNITESWLYWVAFVTRQGFLSYGEEAGFSSVANYKLKYYLGWKPERLDIILKLLSESKAKDFTSIGVDYELFCKCIIKNIKAIRNGYFLKEFKYPYSKDIKASNSKSLSENILINKYIKFADATGKYKYKAYCNFSKAVEDSFLYAGKKELDSIVEFLKGIKQRETYVFNAAIDSLKRRRSKINISYIYWMSFAIKDRELTYLEIDDKTTIKEVIKVTMHLLRASQNDMNNIVSYLDKHKAELTKTLPEINIDYAVLKQSLIQLSKEKFYW